MTQDFNFMEDSKDHHRASHQGQKCEHFCPLLLGVRVTKEHFYTEETE